MTTGREPLLALLGRLGEQARQQGLAAADDLGERSLTLKDDIHISPTDARFSTIRFHLRHEPERIEVTLYLGEVDDPDRRELDAALGAGVELPRSPDAIDRRVVRHHALAADLDWMWTAVRDPWDRVSSVSVEVPLAPGGAG